MSASETFSPISGKREFLARELEKCAVWLRNDQSITIESGNTIINVVVQIYAEALEREGREFRPCDGGVSTTEAVTVISALMDAHRLNTFDLALWKSARGGH